MGQFPSPEDRPDPNDRSLAVRARVPEHVASGSISTGVIVVTGGTEFLLDFVRNLPRPSMVVARIVLPHAVMPQFIDALSNNIQLYRQRFGDLGVGYPSASKPITQELTSQAIVQANNPAILEPAKMAAGESEVARQKENVGGPSPSLPSSSSESSHRPSSNTPNSPDSNGPRQQSPQEVYDDLKLKDELLSGAYANAVMIGHGPHEFCFDFITNFYPQSAVSCRVFMASGHVGRLLDSLRASWEQLKPRLGGNPPIA